MTARACTGTARACRVESRPTTIAGVRDMMKAITIVIATMLLSGCAATEMVTDNMLRVQVGYCKLSPAGKAVARKQYYDALARRPDGGQGYGLDVDCPGDRA